MDALHIGKLDAAITTTVTQDMKDFISERASQFRCSAAEIHREAVYIGLTGMGYSAHVAKDMAEAMAYQAAKVSEK